MVSSGSRSRSAVLPNPMNSSVGWPLSGARLSTFFRSKMSRKRSRGSLATGSRDVMCRRPSRRSTSNRSSDSNPSSDATCRRPSRSSTSNRSSDASPSSDSRDGSHQSERRRSLEACCSIPASVSKLDVCPMPSDSRRGASIGRTSVSRGRVRPRLRTERWANSVSTPPPSFGISVALNRLSLGQAEPSIIPSHDPGKDRACSFDSTWIGATSLGSWTVRNSRSGSSERNETSPNTSRARIPSSRASATASARGVEESTRQRPPAAAISCCDTMWGWSERGSRTVTGRVALHRG